MIRVGLEGLRQMAVLDDVGKGASDDGEHDGVIGTISLGSDVRETNGSRRVSVEAKSFTFQPSKEVSLLMSLDGRELSFSLEQVRALDWKKRCTR